MKFSILCLFLATLNAIRVAPKDKDKLSNQSSMVSMSSFTTNNEETNDIQLDEKKIDEAPID